MIAPLPPCGDMWGQTARGGPHGRTADRVSAGVPRMSQRAVQGRRMRLAPAVAGRDAQACARARTRTESRPTGRLIGRRRRHITPFRLHPLKGVGGQGSRRRRTASPQLASFERQAAKLLTAHVRRRRRRHRRTAVSRTHVSTCVRFCGNRTSTHMCAALWRHMYIWGDQDT